MEPKNKKKPLHTMTLVLFSFHLLCFNFFFSSLFQLSYCWSCLSPVLPVNRSNKNEKKKSEQRESERLKCLDNSYHIHHNCFLSISLSSLPYFQQPFLTPFSLTLPSIPPSTNSSVLACNFRYNRCHYGGLYKTLPPPPEKKGNMERERDFCLNPCYRIWSLPVIWWA